MNWSAAIWTVIGLSFLELVGHANATTTSRIGSLLEGPGKLASWIIDPSIPAFSSTPTTAAATTADSAPVASPVTTTTTPAQTLAPTPTTNPGGAIQLPNGNLLL